MQKESFKSIIVVVLYIALFREEIMVKKELSVHLLMKVNKCLALICRL